eukprot:2281995-Pyramimonas_sp.AAC.1
MVGLQECRDDRSLFKRPKWVRKGWAQRPTPVLVHFEQASLSAAAACVHLRQETACPAAAAV